MFSIPINPKLTETEFYTFYEFCKNYKHLIYDLYFTSRMPPFGQDAMGDVFDDPGQAIETALHIQNTLGIPVSATFNNIMVRPSQQNLNLFSTANKHFESIVIDNSRHRCKVLLRGKKK